METADGLEAIEKAREVQPDLVLFDIGLPKLNGIESAKQVRSLVPSAKLMFVTQESSSEVIQESFRLGAQGYVHKQQAMTDLFPAIDAVLSGQRFVSSTLEYGEGTDVAPRTDLTKAEMERLHYAAILESMDDAVISKDLNGVISSWNPAACRIFGYTEDEAVGQSISLIIPPDLHDEEKEIQRKLRAGQRVDHYETQRVSKDGRTIDVSITVSPIKDATGRIIGVSKVARVIMERKRAEAYLRETEKRFRLVANTAPVMIWMVGRDGKCSYVNQCWLDFTGCSETDLLNDLAQVVHPEDYGKCHNIYKDAFDERRPFRKECRLRRHDGEYRWIVDVGVPRYDEDGRFVGYIGTAVDINDHKEVEESLSNLHRRLIEAQEEERRRIARELHDDISQRLATLTLRLAGLKAQAVSSQVQKGLVEAIQDASAIGKELRALSHRLHSSNLEYLGLVAAASAYCRERSAQQEIEVDFHSDGVPGDLPQEISLCLFRVLQEALQNAINHSGARQFHVTLNGAADEIKLTVCDSGVGFEPTDLSRSRGLGLTSMKERLKLLNGNLVIDSRLGAGTNIHARVPWYSQSSSNKRVASQA
jgi:PAS domain S-box-containing protein